MFTANLHKLPAWESLRMKTVDDGEEWKWKTQLDAARTLYDKWSEVYQLVHAFVDTLPEKKEEEQSVLDAKHLIFENLFIIAPKIYSASGDTLYQIKMENASLIRFNCRQMMEQIGFAVLTGDADEEHKRAIEEAVEEFRLSFRHWVGLFEKDDMEDEWGLFD